MVAALVLLGASTADATGRTDEAAPAARAVSGKLKFAVANIPNRTSDIRFAESMSTLTSRRPSIVMLNEVSGRTDDELRAMAPGYDVYRKPRPDTTTGGSQSMNNVVMWRTNRWTRGRAGRVKLVEDDQGFQHGRRFTWDRYATWVTLRRADGSKASFVSTHLEMYAQGMDVLVELVRTLSRRGPVFVGGDMNSHASQGEWTAAAKMSAAGFAYAKDQGVMYLFYPSGTTLVRSKEVSVASSHPALITTLELGTAARR
jgi:endonuclease/exonuclease/phosphatase family metal-dependent hydrolase